MSTFSDRPAQDAQGGIGVSELGNVVKLFFIRRGAGEFAQILQKRLADLNVRKIHWITQSESDGCISLCCVYE